MMSLRYILFLRHLARIILKLILNISLFVDSPIPNVDHNENMGNPRSMNASTDGQRSTIIEIFSTPETKHSTENLHRLPKYFGIGFVTVAIVLTVVASIFMLKQFCCRKPTTNYSYRKLS